MGVVQKIHGKLQRQTATMFCKTPLSIPDDYQCVSICFDDFPESAINGADILERHNAHGTFYTCFSLLGQDSPSGPIAAIEQVKALHDKGHEIGCHTYDHLNCSFTRTPEIQESCNTNIRAAEENGITLKNFAYPQGGMSVPTKRFMTDTYISARSTMPIINRGIADTHALGGVPVYEHLTLDNIFSRIASVANDGGWLILYSHDVRAEPSQYGVTPQTLEKIVSAIQDKNIPIKTVDRALQDLKQDF